MTVNVRNSAGALSPIHAPTPDDRQFVTALARGLEVLRCFSAARPELGPKEISERIGLPQPTVWRLCYTLSRLGYLVPGASTGKWRVGAPALALGSAALDALQYTEIIRPHLQAMADEYRAAVILAQRHQFTLIYVLRCEGEATFVMKLPVGSSISLLESAVGMACLANMPPPILDELLREADQLAPEKLQGLMPQVDAAREQLQRQGFFVHAGTGRDAVSLAAVPLNGDDQGASYVLLCGGPAFALSRELLEQEIGPRLVRLAQEVRSALPP
jgi:DNA-binding IclR family transcriptional regulator